MEREEILQAAHIPEDIWENCFVAEDGMVFTPLFDAAGGLQSTGREVYNTWLHQQSQPPAPTLEQRLAQLEQQLTNTQLAACELYEQNLALAARAAALEQKQ